MALTQYLHSKGHTEFEGHCQTNPRQVQDLIYLTKKSGISVMEIGFNAGHSAEVFLKNNSDLTLVSFDLGNHDYLKVGKEYIDSVYPNRHKLVLGDSTKTIPEYIANNGDVKFDVIFIDGGHNYHIVKADLENCAHLAHSETIIIVDDTMFTSGWSAEYNIGPTQAWSYALLTKKITEIYKNDYSPCRGMAWGKYIL